MSFGRLCMLFFASRCFASICIALFEFLCFALFAFLCIALSALDVHDSTATIRCAQLPCDDCACWLKGYLLAHSLPLNRDGDEGNEGDEGAESEEMPELPEVWAECYEQPR